MAPSTNTLRTTHVEVCHLHLKMRWGFISYYKTKLKQRNKNICAWRIDSSSSSYTFSTQYSSEHTITPTNIETERRSRLVPYLEIHLYMPSRLVVPRVRNKRLLNSTPSCIVYVRVHVRRNVTENRTPRRMITKSIALTHSEVGKVWATEKSFTLKSESEKKTVFPLHGSTVARKRQDENTRARIDMLVGNNDILRVPPLAQRGTRLHRYGKADGNSDEIVFRMVSYLDAWQLVLCWLKISHQLKHCPLCWTRSAFVYFCQTSGAEGFIHCL